jgi:hypothetical protein
LILVLNLLRHVIEESVIMRSVLSSDQDSAFHPLLSPLSVVFPQRMLVPSLSQPAPGPQTLDSFGIATEANLRLILSLWCKDPRYQHEEGDYSQPNDKTPPESSN